MWTPQNSSCSPIYFYLTMSHQVMSVKGLNDHLNSKQELLTWYLWDVKHIWLMGYYMVLTVQFSCSVMSNSLRPHELQHARPPCPSPTPRVHQNPCSSSRWCHPTISSSVIPFSFCPQSFPASGSFPMSQLFASGGQSIGVSASATLLFVIWDLTVALL